eukprot:236891_1
MSWFKYVKIDYLRQDRLWWRLGCTSAALAVAFGAMGAHYVTPTERFEKTFKTGSQYHFIHSIGLLLVSRACQPQNTHLSRAGLLFSAGILLFCGSLYTVALTGDRSYGKLAPIGGTCLNLAWLCLAFKI